MSSADAFQTPSESGSRPQSPGQMLRAAREARGIHLGVLSIALKVPTRQLEALERDEYEAFKGATFVRALAQSVCRHLGVDPVPVLAGLPKAASPLLAETGRMAQPRIKGAAAGRRSWLSAAASRQVLLAALMLSGSAAFIWWPDSGPATVAIAQAPQEATVNAVSLDQASQSQSQEASTAVAGAALSSSATQPVAVPAIEASAPKVAVAAHSATSAAVAVAPALPAVSAELPLVIRATANNWIEVRDSKGQMLLRRLVMAGETVKLDAAAPLFIYVGRVDSTEVLWHGKPVDLKPHTQNNEARMQIKP